ncbi:MAG: hypothetical protein A2Y38_04105 [Spirochaetes bacterium GWB1_59_5]|nr:MAG: hypothetical protein A2Y38_04105 [Spirochaetes bacterium GWB1_59_5]
MVNDGFFDTMTPEAAWLLGFAASDGTIKTGGKSPSGLGFCLGGIDVQVLYNIREMVETDAPVYEYEHGEGQRAAKLTFSSSRIREFLVMVGFKERYPNCVEGFDRHYIRGLFDGDGCIHYRTDRKSLNLVLAGNYDILAQVSFVIGKELGANIKLPRPTKDNTNQISWEGRIARYLYWWLYSDAGKAVLPRKAAFMDTLPFATVECSVDLPVPLERLMSICGTMGGNKVIAREANNGIEFTLASRFQNHLSTCQQFCDIADMIGIEPSVVRRNKGIYHRYYSVYIPFNQFSRVHTLAVATVEDLVATMG